MTIWSSISSCLAPVADCLPCAPQEAKPAAEADSKPEAEPAKEADSKPEAKFEEGKKFEETKVDEKK